MPSGDIKSVTPDEIEDVKSSKPREIEENILYRVLFLETSKELVLIIPPKLSGEIARNSLSDLKKLSGELQIGEPIKLTPGAEIYLEYERVYIILGWSMEDIAKQISYDLLVALFMQRNEEEDPEVREFAGYFIRAIFKYLRMRKTDIPDCLNDWNEDLDSGFLPFDPISGFIPAYTIRRITDARRAWREEFLGVNQEFLLSSVIINFWIVGYLKGYWQILDSHEDLNEYNKHNRNKLIRELLTQISSKFPEFSNPETNAPEALRKFSEGLLK